MQSDGLNNALSPVVFGDIVRSINTQYNTIQCVEEATCLFGITISTVFSMFRWPTM